MGFQSTTIWCHFIEPNYILYHAYNIIVIKMRVCEINNCKEPTTMMIYRFKIPNGIMKNVWVCNECERKSRMED